MSSVKVMQQPLEHTLTALEIFGRPPTHVPCPSSSELLAVVIEVLPTIDDDLVVDLITELVLAIVDLNEELRAVRATLSANLSLSYTQHTEIVRLQKRLGDLLDERRRARTAA